MCCKEERKLLLMKGTESLKSRAKTKGNGRKGVAGLVPMRDAIATIGRKRIAVPERSHNASASAPVPDRWNRRFQKQRTAISDSPAACHPHGEEENLGQRNINDLPLDILVCAVCKVKHDDLKRLSRVSRKFREAVLIAKQVHFDFTTPCRTRLWNPFKALNSFDSETEGVNGGCSPRTPDAPRNTRKPQARCSREEDIREVAVTLSSLFEDDDEAGCVWRRGGRNRVLFTEGELCRAVA